MAKRMTLEDKARCVESIRADKGYALSKMMQAERYALEHQMMEARVLWWAEDDSITMEAFAQGDTSWYQGTIELYRVSYRTSSPVEDGGYEDVDDFLYDAEAEIKEAHRDYLDEALRDIQRDVDMWM